MEISFGKLPLLNGVESHCQKVVAGCCWCSREIAPLEGAQREKLFWAVPAAHGILPSCEQHPCVMGFTLILLSFPGQLATRSHCKV